jgi:hypothetical protein
MPVINRKHDLSTITLPSLTGVGAVAVEIACEYFESTHTNEHNLTIGRMRQQFQSQQAPEDDTIARDHSHARLNIFFVSSHFQNINLMKHQMSVIFFFNFCSGT